MECLKVLVSAYACEPGKGSEPGVGWNWVRQIARFHDVWVITRVNNREVIEQAMAEEPMPNIHWVYFDMPRWARFWKKGQRGVHPYYYLWQVGIYFIANSLHKEIRFDLVHHVTFGNYWLPSFLALLSVPFVWGPVGGGESCPVAFYRTFSFRGRMYELARNIGRAVSDNNPVHRFLASRVAIALATTSQTERRLGNLGAKKARLEPQCAIQKGKFDRIVRIAGQINPPMESIRFVSAGRLLHWKGYHLGIVAAQRLTQMGVDAEYWIINTGPEYKNLKLLAAKLGIKNMVKFIGKLPSLDDVYKTIASCHVVLHPALHEAFGNVILEAMALGKPVICLDLGGPAMQVTEETGFKIRAESPEQTAEDMAEAMLRLAGDPELRRRMGEASRERVRHQFSWQKKGQIIRELYEEALRT